MKRKELFIQTHRRERITIEKESVGFDTNASTAPGDIYDPMGACLIDTVKGQQQQIDAQQREIDALKAIVANSNPPLANDRRQGDR